MQRNSNRLDLKFRRQIRRPGGSLDALIRGWYSGPSGHRRRWRPVQGRYPAQSRWIASIIGWATCFSGAGYKVLHPVL